MLTSTKGLSDYDLRKRINQFLESDRGGRIIHPWLEDREYVQAVRDAQVARLADAQREAGARLADLRVRVAARDAGDQALAKAQRKARDLDRDGERCAKFQAHAAQTQVAFWPARKGGSSNAVLHQHQDRHRPGRGRNQRLPCRRAGVDRPLRAAMFGVIAGEGYRQEVEDAEGNAIALVEYVREWRLNSPRGFRPARL
jgi:hypothetical protein